MAKTSRPVNPSTPVAVASDDPLESVTEWLQTNGKLLAIGAAVVVAIGLGVYGVRASDAKKQANASVALYAAQGSLYEGKLEEAREGLKSVAERYDGTSAAEQAVLLAQTYYDGGLFNEGLAVLEEARSGASVAFASSMDVMIAAGNESKGNFDEAATRYEAAASAAESETERDGHRLSQARALVRAGKNAEAIALFESLRARRDSPYAQEAAVRLGELQASAR